MEVAYRIAKTRFSGSHEEIFSGVGAVMHGGHWNTKGHHMVYASQSRALATLEISVHLRNTEVLEAYSVCRISIPAEYCEEVTGEDLPAGWDELVVNPLAAQAWGDAWLALGITPVVKVPSVIVPTEWNYLLNPEHDQFSALELGVIESHALDRRIKGNPVT